MDFIDLAAQQQRIRDRLDAAIAAVLDHGRYINGPEVQRFEDLLAAHVGATAVVGVSSGTDALVIAAMIRGVGPGDAVYVPTFTFAATAEAVALLGATPVFVDVDADTANISADSLRAAVEATPGDLRPVGVIPVDMFGLPADIDAVDRVASDHGLWVIADAAQSMGAALGGRPVGTLAAMTTTSFFPAKPLGCYGDGGAIFCMTEEDAVIARSLRVHGSGAHKYDTARIGLNGRLDTLQAAILIEKLAILDDEIIARQRIAGRYSQGLADVVTVPVVPEKETSAWAQYTVRLPRRDAVAAHLREAGVPTAVYYPAPLHRQSAYAGFPTPVPLTRAEALCGEVLSLPMHPYLSEADQDQVIEAVRSALDPT